jgi:hypothetical protein
MDPLIRIVARGTVTVDKADLSLVDRADEASAVPSVVSKDKADLSLVDRADEASAVPSVVSNFREKSLG